MNLTGQGDRILREQGDKILREQGDMILRGQGDRILMGLVDRIPRGQGDRIPRGQVDTTLIDQGGKNPRDQEDKEQVLLLEVVLIQSRNHLYNKEEHLTHLNVRHTKM